MTQQAFYINQIMTATILLLHDQIIARSIIITAEIKRKLKCKSEH